MVKILSRVITVYALAAHMNIGYLTFKLFKKSVNQNNYFLAIAFLLGEDKIDDIKWMWVNPKKLRKHFLYFQKS